MPVKSLAEARKKYPGQPFDSMGWKAQVASLEDPGFQEGRGIMALPGYKEPYYATNKQLGEWLGQYTPSQQESLGKADAQVGRYLHGPTSIEDYNRYAKGKNLPGWENWENTMGYGGPAQKSTTLKDFGGVLLGMLGAVGMGPAGILKSAGMGAKTAATLGGAIQAGVTGGNPVIGALTSGIGAAKPFGTSIPGMMAQGAATSAIQGGNPLVGAALGGINRAQPFGTSVGGKMVQGALTSGIAGGNPLVGAALGGIGRAQPFGASAGGQALQNALRAAILKQNPVMAALMGMANARRQQPVRQQQPVRRQSVIR